MLDSCQIANIQEQDRGNKCCHRKAVREINVFFSKCLNFFFETRIFVEKCEKAIGGFVCTLGGFALKFTIENIF